MAIAVGAFLMTLLGGWVAHRVTDRRHLVLGLAGGLMLGVVGLDLLPEALETADVRLLGVPAPLLCFVLGFLAAHAAERLLAVRNAAHGMDAFNTAARSASGEGWWRVTGGPAARSASGEGRWRATGGRRPQVGLTAATAMVVHSLMDGFAIGAAYQVGSDMAVAVAVAVIAHDFADGFNTYTIASLYGNARRKALLLLCADALAPLAGAAATLAFTLPEQPLGFYLGFFGGVLLYLATSDILPEAHHDHPALSTLGCTVAGVGFMWLVVGLSG